MAKKRSAISDDLAMVRGLTRPMSFRRRWQTSRPDPALRGQVDALLEQSRTAARSGDGARSFELASSAHRMAQNDPGKHAFAHAHMALGYGIQGRLGGVLGELRLGLLAPMASVVRRASGFVPGEPNPAGILKTWRARRG
jgi:hypothetical protein